VKGTYPVFLLCSGSGPVARAQRFLGWPSRQARAAQRQAPGAGEVTQAARDARGGRVAFSREQVRDVAPQVFRPLCIEELIPALSACLCSVPASQNNSPQVGASVSH
jgi:hypothetical protein